LAPALFLWIVWIGPGDQPRRACAWHLAWSGKAETGFPKRLCSNKEGKATPAPDERGRGRTRLQTPCRRQPCNLRSLFRMRVAQENCSLWGGRYRCGSAENSAPAPIRHWPRNRTAV